MREHSCHKAWLNSGPSIAAVGEELFQENHPEQERHGKNAAIAIANIGRMDNGMKQQAQRVIREYVASYP